MWTKEDHHRFPKKSRELVKLLLLIHKERNFTLKDVLISYIIPYSISKLVIPELYIANFPHTVNEAELVSVLGIKVTNMKIARGRSGLSKGYGFLTCYIYDDFDKLSKNDDSIVIRDRIIIFSPYIPK